MLLHTTLLSDKNAPIQLLLQYNTQGIVTAEICLAMPDLAACDVVPTPHDWVRAWKAYWGGNALALNALPVDQSGYTPFRRRVSQRLQSLAAPTTYGALAAAIGSDGASRAVGSVMSGNCVPLIIPCHRVIRSDGSLGQYSAPGGVKTKKKLLDFESTGKWAD